VKFVFEKRKTQSKRLLFLIPFISFVVSLFLSGLLLLIFRTNPLMVYGAMFKGAFGTWFNFQETLVKAIPLMLTGCGVIIAFRMRFWNIGAEGQLVMGGIFAAWVSLFFIDFIPPWLVLPAAFIAAFIGGGLWAGVPAVLKAKLGVDETLTSLMLNYVAIIFYQYLYNIVWIDPDGYGFPGTKIFDQAAWLPRMTGRVHMGLIFALVIALILWFMLKKTKWGFELKVIGESSMTAKYLGINIPRNIILALFISGGISGLAGMGEVTGIAHRLTNGLNMGYGFTAIIIAWMSQLNPIAAIFVSIIMSVLLVGGDQVQRTMGLPSAIGLLLQGMILFPLLAGAMFSEYKVKYIKKIGEVA